MLRGSVLIIRVLIRLIRMDAELLLRCLVNRTAAREWSYDAVGNIARKLLRDAKVIAGIQTQADPDLSRITGGRVIIANHQSILDIVVLSALLPGRVVFVAKDELGKRFPFVSRVLRLQGQALVNRSQPGPEDARRIARLAESVDSRYFLVIFPEGSRSRKGNLLKFQAGALRFALAGQRLPVTAVALDGGCRLRRLDDVFATEALPRYRVAPVASFAPPKTRAAVRELLDHSRESISARLIHWKE